MIYVFLICYFIGITPAYFLARKSYINDVCDGNREEYTIEDRATVFPYAFLSWLGVLVFGIGLWLRNGDLNKKAKW